MAVSPEEWFKSLPPVTKAYLCGAVGTTAAVTFGLIGIESLYLNFDLVFKKFQIWRLVTCFMFFGKFSYPFIFQMFILGRYFNLVESGYYNPSNPGKTAEMVTFVAFGAIVMLVLSFFWNLFFLGPALSFMVMYVWSRKDPMMPISFWGFAIKAWHLPFVMLGMALLMRSSPVLDIVGIFVGHLWCFLTELVPQVYGVTVVGRLNFCTNFLVLDQAPHSEDRTSEATD
eukprot:CAMPEP_0197525024 /NCGR_PEP_ID=MMETSP1318-20131121/10573_1 /TAXON_ID=552666 /ORGANISM="Partenskyella glossopodia, Strain RCC365" /LENGTH=227 /DNA_ID=CAMNT_0043078173 /DNA_START=24 /DNA_END=708 /DNA_ORIENTATION=+